MILKKKEGAIAVLLLVILPFAFAAAPQPFDGTQASHEVLYTDTIDSKSIAPEASINVVKKLIAENGVVISNGGLTTSSIILGAGSPITDWSQVGAFSKVAGANDIYFNLLGGKVGIGTTTPSKLLDVAGTIKSNELCLGGTAAADCKTAWPSPGISSVFWQQDAATSKLFYNDGSVGIGTSAPGRLLDVAGTVRATLFEGSGASLTNLPVVNDLSKVNKAGDTMTGSLTLSTGALTLNTGLLTLPVNGLVAGTNQLVLIGGKVGIGTTTFTGTNKLEVSGDIGASHVNAIQVNVGANQLRSDGLTVNEVRAANKVTAPSLCIGSGATADCKASWPAAGGSNLWTGSSPNIYYNVAGGSVGIGTNSPASKLNIKVDDLATSPLRVDLLVPGEVALLGGWPKRRQVTITNPNAVGLVDYPVRLPAFDTLTTTIPNELLDTDCKNLRFFDGETPLSYWIESGCRTASTNIWVKVPIIPASGTKTITMNYGKTGLFPISSKDSVFEFSYDFEGPAIDNSKIDYGGGGITSISGSILSLSNDNTAWDKYVYTDRVFQRAPRKTFSATIRPTNDVANHDFVIGWHDGGIGADKNDFVHGVYITYDGGNKFKVIEDGVVYPPATPQPVSPGVFYDIKIELGDFGAKYYYKLLSSPTWNLLFTSSAISESDLRSGISLRPYSISTSVWTANWLVRTIAASEPTATIGAEEVPAPGTNIPKTAIFVDSQGNVGIGTTSPSKSLDVIGEIGATGAISSPQFCLNGICKASWPDGSGAASGVWAQTGTDIYYTAGKVGIGTATPQSQLNLVPPAGVYGLQIENNGAVEIKGKGSQGFNIYADGQIDLIAGLGGTGALNIGADGQSATIWLSGGKVGIGTSAPTQKLHVEGGAYKTLGGTAWAVPSDARLKKNIHPLANSLDMITSLQGVSFEWKNPKDASQAGPHMGLISQEVEKVIPAWVKEGSDGFKILAIEGFEALAIESIKELKAENDALRERIELLEQKNS